MQVSCQDVARRDGAPTPCREQKSRCAISDELPEHSSYRRSKVNIPDRIGSLRELDLSIPDTLPDFNRCVIVRDVFVDFQSQCFPYPHSRAREQGIDHSILPLGGSDDGPDLFAAHRGLPLVLYLWKVDEFVIPFAHVDLLPAVVDGRRYHHLDHLYVIVNRLGREARRRHLRDQLFDGKIIHRRKRQVTEMGVEPLPQAVSPGCGGLRLDRFPFPFLYVLEPPLSLASERNTMVDGLHFVEVFLGIGSTSRDHFPSFPFPLGFRQLTGTADRAQPDALVSPFLLPRNIDPKPHVIRIPFPFHVTFLARSTSH